MGGVLNAATKKGEGGDKSAGASDLKPEKIYRLPRDLRK